MMIRRLFLVFFFASLLTACDNNEAEFPVIVTAEAQEIGATSVVLSADIKETGTIRPINYGFLWDTATDPNLYSSAQKLEMGSTDVKRMYSAKLDGLTPATTYHVKGYAANADYSKIYYGNEIVFTTLN